jgi:Family of unknown function (DUF6328)
MPTSDKGSDVGGAPGRHETEYERLDRNLLELLNELRVAIPGVQVLFAFLLTVPFTQRFTTLNAAQEKIYYSTLVCTALATAFLIAPSAHHRIAFRQQDKAYIVFLANRLMIVGLGLLALAMSSAMLLITDVLFGTTATVVATGITVGTFAVLWYAIPLWRRMRLRRAQS